MQVKYQTMVHNRKYFFKIPQSSRLLYSIWGTYSIIFKMDPGQNGKSPYYGLYELRNKISFDYFFWYITSLTSFTVRGTSGNAAATRLGA